MPQPSRPQPERSCVACRTKRPKRSLLRLVVDAGGRLTLDARGRAPGRGAYLCRDAACWQRAAEGRPLSQALRTDLDDTDRALLRAGPPPPPPLPPGAEPEAPGAEIEPPAAARYATAGKMTL